MGQKTSQLEQMKSKVILVGYIGSGKTTPFNRSLYDYKQMKEDSISVRLKRNFQKIQLTYRIKKNDNRNFMDAVINYNKLKLETPQKLGRFHKIRSIKKRLL